MPLTVSSQIDVPLKRVGTVNNEEMVDIGVMSEVQRHQKAVVEALMQLPELKEKISEFLEEVRKHYIVLWRGIAQDHENNWILKIVISRPKLSISEAQLRNDISHLGYVVGLDKIVKHLEIDFYNPL